MITDTTFKPGCTMCILTAMTSQIRKDCEGDKRCYCIAHVDKAVLLSFTRIWHDTMKSLRVVCQSSTAEPIKSWRSLGLLLGLREGVEVTTLKKPSTPSDQPYWRISKRCFWQSCCCCTPFPPHVHKLRVCRGCWRVLYCSTRCQKM